MTTILLDSPKGKAFAVLLVVFLAGVTAGALAVNVYERVAKADSRPHHSELRSSNALAVEHLREELALDERQVGQVQDILDHCIMQEADLLFQIRHMKGEARQQILRILNNEQRSKFDSVLQEVSPE